MKELKLLGIGQGCLIPSYRYRLEEVKTDFLNENIDFRTICFTTSSYPPEGTVKRILWLIRAIINRLPIIKIQNQTDIIILQREMISTLYTLERFFRKPFIFDIDDAIHLNEKFNSIAKIATKAKAIVVCNQYLADYYKKFNQNIYIIPTPINTKKYKPLNLSSKKFGKIVIGWIGTSSNFKSLKLIEGALNSILEKYSHVILKVVANENPQFTKINPKQYIYKRWSEQNDVSDIQSFDIGIMPLINNDHSRGKCAFKMLQYMACGIPVISTCLPMNKQILNIRKAGFCVDGYEDTWIEALDYLINNNMAREKYGKNGRAIVETYYSSTIYVEKYITILKKIQKDTA